MIPVRRIYARVAGWVSVTEPDPRIIASVQGVQRAADRVVRAVQHSADDAEGRLRFGNPPR